MASWFATVCALAPTPAARCRCRLPIDSLVGMLATQGLVSRAGIVPRSLTQDRAGPLGRSVYDVAVMIDAMAGFSILKTSTRAKGWRRYPQATWAGQLTGARPQEISHWCLARSDEYSARKYRGADGVRRRRSKTCRKAGSASFRSGCQRH